jgi:hypothetical protein
MLSKKKFFSCTLIIHKEHIYEIRFKRKLLLVCELHITILTLTAKNDQGIQLQCHKQIPHCW